MNLYRETEDGGVEKLELDPESPDFQDRVRKGLMSSLRVDLTTVGDYVVSTVFLVLDHNFGSGPPLLYETVIFKGDDSDVYMERYTSRKLAQAGHNRIVNKVRLGWVPDGE